MQTQGFNGGNNGSFVPRCDVCGGPTPLNVQHLCPGAPPAPVEELSGDANGSFAQAAETDEDESEES